jgi:hypothetical protein
MVGHNHGFLGLQPLHQLGNVAKSARARGSPYRCKPEVKQGRRIGRSLSYRQSAAGPDSLGDEQPFPATLNGQLPAARKSQPDADHLATRVAHGERPSPMPE